jgi:hypothetical protein
MKFSTRQRRLRLSGSLLTRRALPTGESCLRWHAPLESWLRLMPLVGFFGLCVFVFYSIERPIRLDQSDLRLGADSQTYFDLADMLRQGGAQQGQLMGLGANASPQTYSDLADMLRQNGTHRVEFIGLGANFIGPILMALVMKTPLGVMAGNMALFVFAIAICSPIENLSRTTLALLLALNATTLVSLVTLNKEIFALVASLLLCRYLYTESKSKLLLAAILIFGVMARWEQSAITLLFLFFRREGSFFRRHPYAALSLVIAVITFAYPLALNSRGMDLSAFTDQAQSGNGVLVLNQLQSSYGFPLVVIPKALMLLFERLLSPAYWLTDYLRQDFTDLANQYVIHLHCLAMLVLLLVALLKGRLRMSRPLPFFMALYLIITAANPFIQPRYEYPIYVLLCFELALREWTPGLLHVRGRFHPLPSQTGSPRYAEEG